MGLGWGWGEGGGQLLILFWKLIDENKDFLGAIERGRGGGSERERASVRAR